MRWNLFKACPVCFEGLHKDYDIKWVHTFWDCGNEYCFLLTVQRNKKAPITITYVCGEDLGAKEFNSLKEGLDAFDTRHNVD